ncbi:uncharacterized protein BCN122_III0284 [Burkholderia cenocepacia]|nr:uncharacterized protein BCN122_III0284 [Burkholderia cenocepacia]
MSPPSGIVIVGDGRIARRQPAIWASLKPTVTICSIGQFLPGLMSLRMARAGWRRAITSYGMAARSFVVCLYRQGHGDSWSGEKLPGRPECARPGCIGMKSTIRASRPAVTLSCRQSTAVRGGNLARCVD